jgi:hypothetical protein
LDSSDAKADQEVSYDLRPFIVLAEITESALSPREPVRGRAALKKITAPKTLKIAWSRPVAWVES